MLYQYNKKLMYYAIHEINPYFTKNNLFSCFTTDPNSDAKLNITDNNNKPPLKTSIGDIYTDDSSFYLYDLQVDEKMNKIFYTDDNSFNLHNISYQDKILKPNGKYIEVGHFFPPLPSLFENIRDGIPKNEDVESCKKRCDNDNNCNYLYHVNLFDKKICVLGKKNDSNNIIPVYSNNNIDQTSLSEINNFVISNNNKNRNDFTFNINSSLHIKDKIIDMSNIDFSNDLNNKNFLNKKENKVIIKDEKIMELNKYKYYSNDNINKPFRLEDVQKNDINKLKEVNETIHTILFGNKDANKNNIEPFNSYDMLDCTVEPQKEGCFEFIQKKKIDPLKDITTEIVNTNEKTRNVSISLKDNLSNVNNKWNNLKYNSLYYPEKNEKNSRIDGLKDDMNELLLQENNMYILGALTTATLLITSIMFSMN